ncbi:secretion protein EspA [Edwardsiella ictaluri]|uniref:secretion protein EspA n=1 Tax=Edwardsiella ictaluri TaxID=67780 RepID=UPI0037844E16
MAISIDNQGSVNHFGISRRDLDHLAGQGDGMMTDGIDEFYKVMNLYIFLAQGKFALMQEKTNRSRDSQLAANQVDSIIAQLKKADDTGDLPPEVLQYLHDHNINITVQNDGKNGTGDIDSYLKSIGHPDGKGLNKGQLDAIKGALETDSGRCSDFSTQSQLQIQKEMQSYGVSVNMINSMQTLLADMNKSIAQNIR